MRVLAFETFDQIGKLWSDGARLSAVLPRLRGEGFKTTVAVAERPIQQGIDGNRCAFGSGNVEVAGSDRARR